MHYLVDHLIRWDQALLFHLLPDALHQLTAVLLEPWFGSCTVGEDIADNVLQSICILCGRHFGSCHQGDGLDDRLLFSGFERNILWFLLLLFDLSLIMLLNQQFSQVVMKECAGQVNDGGHCLQSELVRHFLWQLGEINIKNGCFTCHWA